MPAAARHGLAIECKRIKLLRAQGFFKQGVGSDQGGDA